MSKNETVRVRPDILKADQEVYVVVQAMANYQPVNAAYSKDALAARQAALHAAQEASIHADKAQATARDNLAAAEWQYHNAILGTKEQAIAQFGSDSNEVQSLGLKKKSERARPARKKGGATPS